MLDTGYTKSLKPSEYVDLPRGILYLFQYDTAETMSDQDDRTIHLYDCAVQ